MQKVAIQLRLDLAQYREVASFAQLTPDLDAATLDQLHRGERLVEVLKQPPHAPMPVDRQVCVLWAAANGYLDNVPLRDVPRFQHDWLDLLTNAYPDAGRRIRETGDLTPETETVLRSAVRQLQAIFKISGESLTLSPERVVPRLDDQEERLGDSMLQTAG